MIQDRDPGDENDRATEPASAAAPTRAFVEGLRPITVEELADEYGGPRVIPLQA